MKSCTDYEELKNSWGYREATKYSFVIEVVEGEKSTCHKIGDTFDYPKDRGLMCPWLLDSLSGLIRVLEFGGTLPWKYEGTPYEKVMDPKGVTTEFVRCPDPSDVGIVVKITRTCIE
jgi:uncharacterized repeat protein (TIGR04076 family)